MGVIIGLYTPISPPPPPATIPTVTTTTLSSIQAMSAVGGGNVTSDGGATVTDRGICWSTSPNPTISNSKTSDGTGTGVFSSDMRILDPSVTYYVRAYATNSQGTGYGAQQTITTKDFRILKIDKTQNRLTSSAATQEMLDLISNNEFNWIQLYGLNTIMASNSRTASMATFISKSRTLGVERVGAIRSLSQTRWNQVLNYNSAHPWYEQFDDFNIENEFWFWPSSSANPSSPNYPVSPVDGKVKFPESQPFTTWEASGSWLKSTIDGAPYNRGNAYTASGGKPWVISAYVQNYRAGSSLAWINPYATGSAINNIVDVYEATNYNPDAPDPTELYVASSPAGSYPQLNYIASAAFDAGITRSFVPIFSLEQQSYGAENDFSGDYFNAVGLNQGETFWNTDYSGINFTHKSNLKLIGHNYFDYEWVSASVGV